MMMPSSPAGVGDFNFDSTCSSPYATAPASPQGFNNKYYFTAPNSPSAFYRQISFSFTTLSQNPENSREKSTDGEGDKDDDSSEFAFDNYSGGGGRLETSSLSSADELFDGGKIKPLEFSAANPKKMIKKSLSFGKKKKCSDDPISKEFLERGRERNYGSLSRSRREKGTKSLSPLRNSDMVSELEPVENKENSNEMFSGSTFSWLYRQWKMTELLFRSKSEGQSTNKKYEVYGKSKNENRSSNYASSNGRKKERVSSTTTAHERHYKVKRGAAEEMRRRTFLPYKQNLMGCMDLDAYGVLDPSRGINNSLHGTRQ